MFAIFNTKHEGVLIKHVGEFLTFKFGNHRKLAIEIAWSYSIKMGDHGFIFGYYTKYCTYLEVFWQFTSLW